MIDNFLNIALLSIHSCPYAILGGKDTGGMNVYIRELSRELTKRGHKIDVFTSSHKCGHCNLIRSDHGLKLIHLNNYITTTSSISEFLNQVSVLTSEIEMWQDNNHCNYDLIHSHYWQSGIVGSHLQDKWNIPHVTMFHTLSTVKKLLKVENSDPVFRSEVEELVIQNSDLIIASTEKEKSYLKELYLADPERIRIIPCGINLSLFKPVDTAFARAKLGLKKDEKMILFVGRLEPSKGIENLMKAFNLIKNRVSANLFILGGDENSDNYRSSLQDMVTSLNLNDNVKFKGSVLQCELPIYYSAADLCVIPSYYESFCLVILESLACGTPVLTSNIGEAKTIVNYSSQGAIVENNLPKTLADKMLEILVKSTINNKKEIIRSSIQKYDWSRICDSILFNYYDLVNNYQLCSIGA